MKYLIKFSGAVEVEAADTDAAIEHAWLDEGVSYEDIDSVEPITETTK